MPKPLKKTVSKKSTPTRPSSVPTAGARQSMKQPPKVEAGNHPEPEAEPELTFRPTDDLDTRSIISAYMRVLGAKGGKVSGGKRMEMPKKQRKAIATKAAVARWSHTDPQK